MLQRVNIKVNGIDHRLDIPARRLLVDCLRYDLGLTGSKEGCSVGICGACTVLGDGEMAASCITLAVAVDGAETAPRILPAAPWSGFFPVSLASPCGGR